MINFEQARLNPGQFFKSPREVLECAELTVTQKKAVLESWEYDERELSVAEEENMRNGHKSLLDVIQQALRELHVSPTDTHGSATKQGGRVD